MVVIIEKETGNETWQAQLLTQKARQNKRRGEMNGLTLRQNESE